MESEQEEGFQTRLAASFEPKPSFPTSRRSGFFPSGKDHCSPPGPGTLCKQAQLPALRVGLLSDLKTEAKSSPRSPRAPGPQPRPARTGSVTAHPNPWPPKGQDEPRASTGQASWGGDAGLNKAFLG